LPDAEWFAAQPAAALVNRLDQFAETNAAKIRHAAEPCHEPQHRDPLGEIGSRRMRRGMAMSRIDSFSSVIVRHLAQRSC
jgi:hypothetical protein